MKNLLLIEPNPILAQTYSQAFSYAGDWQVQCAQDGQAGVYVADTTQPDLVVLAMELGEQNGIAFLHEFRSYPDWQRVPVILLTTLPPERFVSIVPVLQRELYVDHVLYKPQTSLRTLVRIAHKLTRGAA